MKMVTIENQVPASPENTTGELEGEIVIPETGSEEKTITTEEVVTEGKIVKNGKPASPEKVTVEEDGDKEGKIGNNEFMVGDLVWGKIKSHPWWPGQIYDPSDASEYALTAKREGPLLVAYFGDGTFAWCVESQLVPFTERFDEMSKQSTNKRFLNAVDTALDELARRAELNLKLGLGIGLSEPEPAINAGVRAGVFVPEGDYKRLGLPTYEHAKMLEYVKRLACGASIANQIDLVVIRSWVSVFHRGTCGSDELEEIEDMDEDMDEDIVIEKEEEARTVSGPRKGPRVTGKLKKSEKQKSVAELMADDSNMKVMTRKRKKISEEDKSGKRMGRPRKLEIESPLHKDNGPLSRERKKSKYLSPPFVTPPQKRVKLAITGSEPPLTELTELTEVVVKEVLDEVHRACVEIMSLSANAIEMLKRFIIAFRRSVYVYEARPELKPGTDSGSQTVGSIKLEIKRLTKMIKNCDGKASAEEKESLESEMRSLLEKVGSLTVRSSG